METRMQAVLADQEVYEELKAGKLFGEAARSLESVAPAGDVAQLGGVRDFDGSLERLASGQDPFAPSAAEAIIMRHGYPSLLVRDGTFEQPKLETWRKRLEPYRAVIDTAIAAVGRVELAGHPQFKWIGTGWVLDEQTIVTNRHVADLFVDQGAGAPRFKAGMKASLDFREEYENTAELVSAITGIVHVEPRDSGVDLALLRLDRRGFAKLNIEPIAISERLDDVEYVGVIGYPAHDTRNDLDDQARIFDDIYEVKRFAPGRIKDPNADANAFTHICTTLGGNSGSTVIDIAKGSAVGLHFGGREGQANYAVKPGVILERATSSQVQVRRFGVAAGGGGASGSVASESAKSLAERPGFDPEFLGAGRMAVALPQLNPLQMRQVARTSDGQIELKYLHFSLVMNAARRLAFYTAVNIDGTDLWHRPRGRDKWKTDPRLPEDAQVDNALYRSNDFDRGHLVRRLDPVWGPKPEATQAEDDTFHYTNAAPQHKDLNQKIWLDLENHVMNRTEDQDARISVLAGPIFGTADPRSKRPGLEEVGIPLGFWKVIASIRRNNRGRKTLDAQAFVIWQWDMFGDRDLELVFGQGFETYQLSVLDLERLTGLDFQTLRAADTFGEPAESLPESAAESISQRRVYRGVVDRAQHIRSLDDVI